jgi:hypothetical protein
MIILSPSSGTKTIQIIPRNRIVGDSCVLILKRDGDKETERIEVGKLDVELITNGGFDTDSDWDLGAGWSIENGLATNSGSDININPNININQYVGNFLGKEVLVEFDVIGIADETMIRAEFGGSFGAFKTDSGRYSAEISPINSRPYLFIYGYPFEGSIDNVSIREKLNKIDEVSSEFIKVTFSPTILTEDSTYSLEIINNGVLWYRDKVYVTSRNQEEIETTKHVIGNNQIYKPYDATDDNTYII